MLIGRGKEMEWIKGLQRAIDYMEEHLEDEADYAEIARQAYSSSFHFQRIFHIVCGCTVGEYIRNRRLSSAGEDLLSGEDKVIDIAMKYGYNSPESFSRAFTKFHGITPAQVKKGNASLKSFSKVSIRMVLEGGKTMDYRIEKREAFQVIAKKARYEGGGELTQKNIHATWDECIADGTCDTLCKYIKPENIFGDAIVGICFDDPSEGDFDYAVGAAYTAGEPADGLTMEEIPASTWVIFPCKGKMPDAFQKLYKRIYTEFFPTSRYQQPEKGMCIEVYPSAEVTREDYYCEIWLSVEEK